MLFSTANYPVETYASAGAFAARIEPTLTGCLLLDLQMPGMSGLELLAKMNENHIVLPAVVMTAHGSVDVAVEAMRSGAADFLEKPFEGEALLKCVNRIVGASREQERQAVLERLATLSNRECEVLARIVSGKPNKLIAYELAISMRTVEIHRAQVMAKMDAENLAELVRMALLAPEAVHVLNVR